jgi:glutamine synthetase
MQDILQRLRTAGVHTVLAQFTDLHGVAKGKYVPLEHLDELLALGAGFSGPSIAGTGLPRTGPRSEYYARGNASTLMPLPWQPGIARMVCDGFVAGEPFEACPRQVLRRQVARLAANGWHLRTGIEPEFFLLKREGANLLPFDDLDRLDKPSYDLRSLARRDGFLQRLHQALAGCGLDVLQLDHEDAHGQYEVNFGFDEALASCDHLMLFKLAAARLAEAEGMVFSMMPKPFANQPGSGMHFHVSLWKGEGQNAANLFLPHTADGALDSTRELSPLAEHFIAGVMAHTPALTALAAPTINSYKRLGLSESLSGTSWAPAQVAQGANNRTALVRTLRGRFEWRLPDASCNPYLVTAALIAAGLDGVARELPCPPACAQDLFETQAPSDAAPPGVQLPRSLAAALSALQQDAVIRQALGEHTVAQFVALKAEEVQAFDRHVSPWEVQRYGAFF